MTVKEIAHHIELVNDAWKSICDQIPNELMFRKLIREAYEIKTNLENIHEQICEYREMRCDFWEEYFSKKSE